MVVVVLFNAGAQVPVIPFSDVVGSAVNVAPAHIGATGLNVGVTAAPSTPTVMLNVAVQFRASRTVMI